MTEQLTHQPSRLPRIARPPRIWRGEEFADTEPTPKVEAFLTEKGSAYVYDDFGRTTRHKTKTGETYQAQDLAVFVALSPNDKEVFLEALHHSMNPNIKVYVVERQPNNAAVKIRRPEDIVDPDQVYLAVCQTDPSIKSDHNIVQLLKARKATLQPEIGSYVYDTRRFTDEQQRPMTERHLGHRVAEIKYAGS